MTIPDSQHPRMMIRSLPACAVALLVLISAAHLRADGEVRLDPATTEVFVATPDEVPAVQAAETLIHWLRKAARVDQGFPLRRSAPPSDGPAGKNTRIIINDPSIELPPGLPADTFILRTGPNTVSIRGKAGDAPLFGVVELLRILGVHFYMPTELFTVLPEGKDLVVPPLDVVSAPYVFSLFFSGLNWQEAINWGRLNAANRRKGGTHQHNSFAIFPPEKFAERYPDIYPIHDGKRYIPPNAKDQSWQPNFLSPHIVDAAMESVTEHFAKNPQDEYIAVSIQDGRGFCQGPETTAVVDKFRASGAENPLDRAHSFIYWNKFIRPLAERMKKEFPNKLLVALAYAGTTYPPEDPLPDNVAVFTNFHIAEYLAYEQEVAAIEAKGGNASDLETGPDRWLSLVKHYGNHDWYQGSGYLMPRSYSGNWHRYLQRVKSGAEDALMHVETYPNWGFDGHKYYILARMLWNPSLNPEQLTKEMCQNLFGPAAPAMENYFFTMEELWNLLDVLEGPERKLAAWDRAYTTTPQSRKLVAQARESLDKAATLAADPLQKQRITLFSECFSIAEMMFDLASWQEFDEAKLEAYDKQAREIVERYGYMALMHPNTIDGIKFLGAHVQRALAPDFDPPLIADRDSLLPADDPQWQKSPVLPFKMADGKEDLQQTTLQLARDSSNLYVLVKAPRIRQRDLVIDERATWRSDNIEFKLDSDGDWGRLEGQFWVKPNGLLVDYAGGEPREKTALTSETKLDDKQWVLSARIPLEYVGQKEGPRKPVGLQVFRNEFKIIPGFNQTDYVSLWAGRVK